MGDSITWSPAARVEKYSQAQITWAVGQLGYEPKGDELRHLFAGVPEDGIVHDEGNLLVTAGLGQLTNLIIGGGDEAFSHANAIVGVGNSTTTALIGDTALGADNTSNAYYQQADSANPTQSAGTISCQCTFASGSANFAWNEWCLCFGGGGTITAGDHLSAVTGTAPTMMNHKVTSLGTKASGASWVFSASLTIM